MNQKGHISGETLYNYDTQKRHLFPANPRLSMPRGGNFCAGKKIRNRPCSIRGSSTVC